jgi:hypothetical protein
LLISSGDGMKPFRAVDALHFSIKVNGRNLTNQLVPATIATFEALPICQAGRDKPSSGASSFFWIIEATSAGAKITKASTYHSTAW